MNKEAGDNLGQEDTLCNKVRDHVIMPNPGLCRMGLLSPP